jgi:hypothetical protein
MSTIAERNRLYAKQKEIEYYNKLDTEAISRLTDPEQIAKLQARIDSRKLDEDEDSSDDENEDSHDASKLRSEMDKIKYKELIETHRQNDRKEYSLPREVERTNTYFNKINDNMPQNILDNLAKMPNNKGYVWKSMHCYGEMPAESDIITLLDRQKGGITIIHEYTATHHNVYHSAKGKRKELVSSFKRMLLK